jgi:hypothetical protein
MSTDEGRVDRELYELLAPERRRQRSEMVRAMAGVRLGLQLTARLRIFSSQRQTIL